MSSRLRIADFGLKSKSAIGSRFGFRADPLIRLQAGVDDCGQTVIRDELHLAPFIASRLAIPDLYQRLTVALQDTRHWDDECACVLSDEDLCLSTHSRTDQLQI